MSCKWFIRYSAAAVGVLTRVWETQSNTVSSRSCPTPVIIGIGNWAQLAANSYVSNPEKMCIRDRPYTTVASIVNNLKRKGYVTAKRFGNTYQYTPVVKQSEYKRTFISGVVRNYFADSYKEMVSFFAKEQKISAADLKAVSYTHLYWVKTNRIRPNQLLLFPNLWRTKSHPLQYT